MFTIRSTPTIKPILAITAVITFAAPAAALAQAAPTKAVTSFTGDLGYVDATGNTRLSTLSVGDKIVHTDGKWTVTQLASYVYGETNTLVTANQFRVEGRVDFDLLPRFGVFGGASYERNTFAGFTARTDEIAGLRWKAIVEPMDSLNVDAGGVATQESDVDGTTKTYPAARLAAAYKHRFSKTAYFQQLGEYIPDLQTSGSYRANSESSLVAPISSHVGIKVSYSIRYDSRPPVKFGTTDRLLTTGVQISY